MQNMIEFSGDQHVAEDEGECFLDCTLQVHGLLELCIEKGIVSV
jgi:hypothetical protein